MGVRLHFMSHPTNPRPVKRHENRHPRGRYYGTHVTMLCFYYVFFLLTLTRRIDILRALECRAFRRFQLVLPWVT